MQLVADDLDVRPLGLHHGDGGRTHGLAERVVLVDQVDLLDVGLRLHVVGQRFHLDIGVGIPPEVRIGAFVIGQDRIDGGIIEVQDLFAGIALVVLGDPLGKGCGDGRAVALRDDARAGIDGLLHLDQAFLGVGLVVEGQDLELLAGSAAFTVQLFGEELEGLEANFTDGGPRPRQRVDIGDLNGLLGECRAVDGGQCTEAHKGREQAGRHGASEVFPMGSAALAERHLNAMLGLYSGSVPDCSVAIGCPLVIDTNALARAVQSPYPPLKPNDLRIAAPSTSS